MFKTVFIYEDLYIFIFIRNDWFMIVQSGVFKERPYCINLLMYKQTHTQTQYYSQADTTSDTTGNRHTDINYMR